MDNSYTQNEIDESQDNEALFMQHVVGDDDDLVEIDNMLHKAFSTIE